MILASNNAHKLEEFRAIFADMGIEIIPQSAAGLTDTVLVGMLDTENQSLKFVSIPRDTAVNVSYKPK